MDIAARAMGLQIQVFNTSTSREIDVAFEAFARERPRSRRKLSQKKFGPATDAGADEFCAINTGA